MKERKATPLNIKARGWIIPYLIYAVLSAAVLGPLLSSGYILTLDMIYSPNLDFIPSFFGLTESVSSVSAAIPFQLLQQVGSGLPPGWLFQKIVLFLILFLAAVGAHRLFRRQGIGAYFAGLLYMINPFTYVRFLAGQWGVLAAYAMTPFAIKAFIELLENANSRNAIKVAVLSTLVGLLQIHGFFLLLFAFLIIFVVRVVKERKALPRLIQAGKYVGLSAALFCSLNFYWLLPVLTAKDTILSQLSRADLLAFVPKPTSALGVEFDIASMHGFWRLGYTYANDIVPFWWLLFAFILFLAVYGLISNYRKVGPLSDTPLGTDLTAAKHSTSGWMVVSFGIIGVASFLLALGASSEVTRPPFEWLWEHVPFFRGFRDSHKFVSLLVLCYAYLGGLGVNELGRRLKQQTKKLPTVTMTALIVVALLIPPAYSFTMFGFYQQLGTTDYPQEWYQTNHYLNQDEDDFNVLFLPWHLYMDYSWLPNRDKRLVNPAPQFFDKPVISGDNIEVPGIYSQSTNPISKYVEFLLRNGKNISNLGELLAPLNVRYIILVSEADYESYDFLYQQEDLRVELEKPGITLFRNEHPTTRVYAVDSVVYIKSLEEYLELSKSQDVMKHLYIMGSEPSGNGNAEAEELNFAEKSPVTYQVEGTSHRYTVFSVPQNVGTEHWEYNGKKPLKNLGFMPTFESSSDGGKVIYTRFYQSYLPSYIVSLLAFAWMIWYYFYLKSKKPDSDQA